MYGEDGEDGSRKDADSFTCFLKTCRHLSEYLANLHLFSAVEGHASRGGYDPAAGPWSCREGGDLPAGRLACGCASTCC